MKKAELKQGVAYFVSTNNRSIWTYRDSYYEIAEHNKGNRYYVIFEDGQPRQYRGTPSSVYLTSCKTYGADCPTHTEANGYRRCPMREFRLMDIRDEFFNVIKQLHDNRLKEKNSRDPYAERLKRIARRKQDEYEKPIKDEFFKVMKDIRGHWTSEYTRLEDFTTDQMQLITEALKAHQRAGKAVA